MCASSKYNPYLHQNEKSASYLYRCGYSLSGVPEYTTSIGSATTWIPSNTAVTAQKRLETEVHIDEGTECLFQCQLVNVTFLNR